MKLHLPKQLFTALLSAIVLATPTAVTLGSAAWANSGLHNNANYLLGGTGAGGTVQDAYTGLQETTLDGKVTTLVTELNAESLATFNLWADDSRNAWTNALVSALRVQNGATIKISESQWKHENGTVVRYFDELHIENLQVAGGGAAVLNVSLASHNVVVDGVTGVLSSVTNAGSLTLGEIGSSVTLGGNVTNSGTLTLRGDIYGTSTIMGGTVNLVDFSNFGNLTLNGSVALSGDIKNTGTLTLHGGVSGTSTITGGTVNLVDFSNVGNLTFGAVQVSGVLGMNGSGNVTWESLELAEGTILEYGKGANTLNIGTIDKSVTLYLYEVEEGLRSENGVKLGISLGEGQTLESIRDYLRVDGLASDASFALKEVDGAVYISSTGALDSGWDNHWGASGLANRPTTSISIADPTTLSSAGNSSETFYMVDSTFSAGEVVSVELTGEGDYSGNAVIVGGFATTQNSNDQGSVERDVWIKASSGQYKGIVGGNVADNWGGPNIAAHFTGDTHIVVDGATVGAIIGGTYRDSKTAISPIFTGDTYISVLSGDVKDFIFGAAANTHNSTTTFNGNTNIYVYVPLVNNATGSTLGDRGAINAIVGGAGKVANDATDAKSYINGNTNVTIDLSGYNGALTTFAKQIVGGSKNVQNSYFSLISGNTYVNILGKDGITFTKEVIGGSAFNSAGTATITGSTNVHISGGSFSGLVIGGNYNYSTTGGTMRVGNVNMGIGGDVNNNIIGANYVSSGTATISARDIAITVGENGASIWNLVGGHYVGGTGSVSLSGSLGDVTITLAGGTIKDTYGGSWILRNKPDATITQGDIHIDLQSGNLNGNIYAAGRQAGSSKMTTASTKVSIGSDVSITIPGSGNRIISGGYRFENDNSGSTVTGGRTLVFNGESQDRSAITFDGFDIIQVTQKNAVVTLGNLTNFESLTKTGAGTLTMSGANTYTGGTVVSEGKLVIGSAGAVGSGAVTVNAGATLEVGTMPTDWTAANMLAGKVTGTGTLLVSAQNLVTGASAYATTFGGTLELANGVMFTFGGDTDGGQRDSHDVNTKSITGFILNSGSTLQYQGTGANAQFNNLQVKAGTSAAVLKLIDTGDGEANTVKLTGVTQLDNELKLQANWSGRFSVEQLSGAGTLTSSGGTNENFHTTINSLEGFTGKLSFTDNSNHVVLVKTGTETPVKFTSLDAVDSSNGSFAFEVGAATEVNTVNIASGSVTIAADASLSLLGDAQKFSAIGTLGGAGDFVNVDGSSTIETLSGFSGDLSVQGGALVVNTYNAIETMAVTVNNGASLSIGTVNVDAANHGLTAEGAVTYVYSDGSNDRNGYQKSIGTYVLFDGYVWEGSVGGIATEVDRDANKTYLSLSTEDRTRFYVNEGTENYDTTDSSLHISSDNTAGIILNGGNLNVLTSLNQNATGGITVQRNATITLATDAQLNEGALSVVEGAAVTLSGSGTYALLDGKISRDSTNIALATDGSWSGITKISNVAYSSTTSNNSLATMLDTAGSGKLMLTNVNGWLGNGDNTGSKTLILENGSNGEAGLYLSNGSSGGTATFNGGVEGSGDIRFSWSAGTADSESKYKFTGSTSQWYGKFIADSNNGNKDVKVSFTKDGSVFSDTEIGGGVENQSNRKLTVEIGSTSGDIDFYGTIGKTETATGSVDLKITNNQVALHRNVTATNLTVDGGATAVVNATLTAADTVQLGDAATIRAKQDSAISMSNVQMSSSGVSAASTANGAKGSITDADVQIAQLAADASFTIQDMTLTNTTITAATVNTHVSFDNVTMSGAVVLKNLKVAMTDAQVAAGGSEGSKGTFTGSTTLLSGITMNAGSSLTVDLGDLSSYAAMGPGKYDLSITLSGFSMADFAGAYADSALQFAADSWLGKLLAQSNNANVEISISQVAAGEAAAAGAGAATGVSYSTGSVGTIITINGLNVPEPTTSTLSLLALAGLCARRRRK